MRMAMVGLIVSGLFVAMVSSASGLTLGTTTIPSGAAPSGCSAGSFFTERATDASYQYTVPAGGGAITSWSANTVSATPGTSLTLLVLRPGSGEYTVVGFDTETLPNPLPGSGVATFNLASPIAVSGGEVIGLYGSASTVACYFSGGTIPPAEEIAAGAPVGSPSVGAAYKATANAPGYLVNVSANLVNTQDVGVTGAATPSSITAGGAAEYAFTVSNGGAASGSITFTDAIPSGLKIFTAVAGSGSCSTTGQTVTCTISGLHPGASAPVSVIVSAAAAGNYPDSAAVSASLADPNPANNSTSTTLTVSNPPAPPCKTVRLTGLQLAFAKQLIGALNCKVGKVTSKASKSVRKGLVISTNPGAGQTLAAGSAVSVVVSSGPPKKKKKKHKKKH
jgi:uncharacterized repeat protein (TIGR01451 family)